MRYFLLATGLLSLLQLHSCWTHRALKRPPGILVKQIPEQTSLDPSVPHIQFGKFDLQPLANYKITARVISRQSYWLDWGAALSPLDLCVGWGLMSNSVILDELSFKHRGRFCLYQWSVAPPLPEDVLNRSMANIHTIASNKKIEETLRSSRPGRIIRLEGYLVQARDSQGGDWTSSLSRDDSGFGACELMYITHASLVD